MNKKRVKTEDRIVNINGVKYIVRYVNGIKVGKMTYTDFVKHCKG